ncbi:hypothetical protein [Edaphobacter modestus]|uniref:Uncharacterized protein n=1 Tax=Edaphobacter modestus TaxID=388466 RepID=A0A4Q7XX14_9BACT|nr:hypothetical protein [Edaphobacter modestus]RZU28902.1 hypothetical protein BDD14_6485 [Edaphobacter modestus]
MKYDPTIPFVQHFGMYQLPDTMADALEQHRLDRLTAVLDRNKTTSEVFELLATGNDSEVDNFGDLCDPLAFFGDVSLGRIKAGRTALLPPVPSSLADREVGGAALWSEFAVPDGIRTAEDATVALVATLVATSFCDDDFVPQDRSTSLRYIGINSVDHPASKVLRSSTIWQDYRRPIELPDMVEQRKADFVQLFIDHGMPLEHRELECLSKEALIDCATDMRYYILERNRHIVFCKRCSNAMLYFNSRAMSQEQTHVF